MQGGRLNLTTALLLLLLNSALATAQEADPAPHGPDEHQAEHHANHVALFAGASTLTGETPEGGSGTAFTLGLDYERRLSRWFGLGLLTDFVLGGTGRAALLGVPLLVHPVGGLGLTLAPGVEFEKEEAEELEARSSGAEEAHTSTHFAFRLGAILFVPATFEVLARTAVQC